jgi:hypothetical protein
MLRDTFHGTALIVFQIRLPSVGLDSRWLEKLPERVAGRLALVGAAGDSGADRAIHSLTGTVSVFRATSRTICVRVAASGPRPASSSANRPSGKSISMRRIGRLFPPRSPLRRMRASPGRALSSRSARLRRNTRLSSVYWRDIAAATLISRASGGGGEESSMLTRVFSTVAVKTPYLVRRRNLLFW